MRSRTILLGPPGTGKTEHLLRRAAEYLQTMAPDRLAFVSFSRRAIAVAKSRMPTQELPHFRTIHSMAYRALGLGPGEVLQHHHLVDFGRAIGLLCEEGERGSTILGLHALARARQMPLEATWRAVMEPDLPWALVKRVVDQYEEFKQYQGLLDFSDMITQAEGTLDVDVLLVDEAQDTSAAQWAFLRRAASHVPTVMFAGDDDQTVYHWSGADAGQLARFIGERVVLPQSYRLPVDVKKLADRIAGRIRRRIPKQFAARAAAGTVDWVAEPDAVDLSHGTWLLLGRTNQQLRELRTIARSQGVVYTLPSGAWSWSLPAVQAALTYEHLRAGQPVTRAQAAELRPFLDTPRPISPKEEQTWASVFGDESRERNWMERLTMPLVDREYVRALRARGESLHKPGRVKILTVHTAKGDEAENVLLLTDLSSRVAEQAILDPDAEHRVQYVAVTRASERLLLVQPRGRFHWQF